jgi:hypothetical protein
MEPKVLFDKNDWLAKEFLQIGPLLNEHNW